MHYSYDQDIMDSGTIPIRIHWIRDCLSYFWELLFLTARSAGICVAMARVPVGQAAQWGLKVWLTGWAAVLGSGLSEKPGPVFRQRGDDWPRGPARRQLPTAGCAEGGCSQGVKLQTLQYGHLIHLNVESKHSLYHRFFSGDINWLGFFYAFECVFFWNLKWLGEKNDGIFTVWVACEKMKDSSEVKIWLVSLTDRMKDDLIRYLTAGQIISSCQNI